MEFVIDPFRFNSELISSACVSGGTVTITGLNLSVYRDVRIHLRGFVPTTDGHSVAFRLVIGGSTITSGYFYITASRDQVNTYSENSSASSANIPLNTTTYTVGNGTGENLSGVLNLSSHSTTNHKMIAGHITHLDTSGVMAYGQVCGGLANSGSVTGIVVYCPDSGGSLASGCVTISGVV